MRMQKNHIIDEWLGKEAELARRIEEAPDAFRHVWDDPAGPDYGHIFGESATFVREVETAAGFIERIVGRAEGLLSARSHRLGPLKAGDERFGR
jgi:hypothetical protein